MRKAVIYYLVIPAVCAVSLLFTLAYYGGDESPQMPVKAHHDNLFPKPNDALEAANILAPFFDIDSILVICAIGA